MTRVEAFADLKASWLENVDMDHPEYTTSDKKIVEDLLDDIERLITG